MADKVAASVVAAVVASVIVASVIVVVVASARAVAVAPSPGSSQPLSGEARRAVLPGRRGMGATAALVVPRGAAAVDGGMADTGVPADTGPLPSLPVPVVRGSGRAPEPAATDAAGDADDVGPDPDPDDPGPDDPDPDDPGPDDGAAI